MQVYYIRSKRFLQQAARSICLPAAAPPYLRILCVALSRCGRLAALVVAKESEECVVVGKPGNPKERRRDSVEGERNSSCYFKVVASLAVSSAAVVLPA